MVVRIRLARHGVRNRPFYHIVVANARAPRDGKHIEKVGLYDPIPNKQGIKNIELNADKIKYWLSVGAQPSDTVASLLSKSGFDFTTPKDKSKNKPNPESEQLESK
ncbi:8329_t:CDS:2 [Funneliformis mosseae]|uniref:8329_t:CDS:1 n=1 Tax=Funneliformis mosseae TaxID=27381 RepID=A0A9N9ADC6_FUNMO|nr:8329_t:CDS:2 [Funneliformis mosseae]